MRILMIHPHDIYSTHEPWCVRIREIAKEFVKKGHQVTIVYHPLPRSQRGALEQFSEKGITTIAFSRRKWALPGNVLRFLKLAKKADVIHFQKCFAHASLPALFSGAFLSKPVHYDWDDHEYAIFNFDPPSWIYGKYILLMEKILPGLADTVSYSSEYLRKMALTRGVKTKNLFEAHVGANVALFHTDVDGSHIKQIYAGKKKLVVYMGQLHGGQYARLFIQAVPSVKAKVKDVVFLVIGGGYLQKMLIQKTHALHLEDDVIFTGALVQKDIPEYLAAADVCVASFEKNVLTKAKSPLKIVEYMAMGKAIVASDVGEVPRMLGESGYKARAGDPYDLAHGIVMMLTDEKKRKLSEKQARLQVLQKYNWTVTAENLLRAYERGRNYHA